MLSVLYRDAAVAVIVKPVGLLSEDGAAGESVCPLIREELGVSEVYPVHRLDRAVGGVMVYALRKNAAVALSAAVQNGELEKIYLAVVHGVPAEPEGVLTDLLFKDSRKNKVYVVACARKGVKQAELFYECLATHGDRTLVRVRLHTGRSHQIRVQFASRKLPLVGDGKYGAADGERQIALFSQEITFPHPESGERITVSAQPAGDAFAEFLTD